MINDQNKNSFVENISGAINTRFYLQSDHFVPNRTFQIIDQSTSSIMENGLYRFYASLNAFRRKLIYRNSTPIEDDFSDRALAMEQLIRPMMFVFYLWGLSVIAFVAELIVSKWRNMLIN